MPSSRPASFSLCVTSTSSADGVASAQPYLTDEDRIAARRLSSLLEYVQELVKLDERVATSLSQHKLADGSKFALHEHELRGLPGVTFDTSDAEGPIWLRVQRLQRVASPAVPDEVRDWIEVSNDPFRLPSVRETRHLRISNSEMDTLLANGEAREEDCAPSLKEEKDEAAGTAYFDVMLRLDDRPEIRERIEAYCARPWGQWSEEEKPRRKSIAVYQRLFEVAQRFLQSGGSEAIELIWGIGLARWKRLESLVDIPMIACGVEIEIGGQQVSDITIRPKPGSAAWWWSRIPWVVANAIALVPLVLAFGRFERPRPVEGPPAPPWRYVTGALAIGGGLALLAGQGVGVDTGRSD